LPLTRAPGAPWDRFAAWPVRAARLLLAALLALLIAAALVPLEPPGGQVTHAASAQAAAAGQGDDQDLALYEAAAAKVAAGQSYYRFIVAEQRARDYPVRPAITVRLPTLAYWLAGLDLLHVRPIAALALMLATVAAWWRRLGEEPGAGRLRRMATALVFVGASLAINPHYLSLHELWAGLLLSLAMALYRSGPQRRWLGAFACVAVALFIRELALPFALLLAASAAWRRDWRELAAWAALVAVFFVALAAHVSIISAQILPSDRPGFDWLAWRGLSGWLGNVVQSGNLRFLPHGLAGPLVVAMTLGWAGWRTPVGALTFLVTAGYAVAFMIAGRWDNFYWGALIVPLLTPGLAFAPRALASLVAAAQLNRLRLDHG
jgi:hypothetical protein